MSRTANNIRSEIATLTRQLLEIGLCIGPSFPETKTVRGLTQVGMLANSNLSAMLKSRSREEIYNYLLEEKLYSMVFNDGSIVQISYTFSAEEITSHRLVYFPKPYTHDVVEAENVDEFKIVKNPLFRFDYSNEKIEDFYHSPSHMHINDLENCRIPIQSPLGPSLFIFFLLRNFYNSEGKSYFAKFSYDPGPLFDETIAGCEKGEFHIGLPLK